MKTESTALYVVRLAGILLAITAIVAACLAGVNSITKPIIDELNAAKTQKAIEAVLPGGYDEELASYNDATGLVSKAYKGANGYAFEVKPAGFDNTITMMVGVDNEGKVIGISIVPTPKLPVWVLWQLPPLPPVKHSVASSLVSPVPFPSPRTAALWTPSPVPPSPPGLSVSASMPPWPAQATWVKEVLLNEFQETV